MGDVLLVSGGLILILIGFIGSALPIIPGPPLSWIGYLLLNWTHYSSDHENYHTWLWIMLFFVILVTILDYIVPIWGTKKWGGSKAGMWGATIGVLVGLWVGPIGVILGPFAGAFIGELLTGKPKNEALRAGWGSFIGFLLGVGMKLMVCGTILFIFMYQVFFR